MKFNEWYNFNKQIRTFCLGQTFVKLFKKYSMKTEDIASTFRMNLEDINFFFGDHEIIFISNYNYSDRNSGVAFGLYNPEKVLDNRPKV